MGQGTESCGGYEVEYDPYCYDDSEGYTVWTQKSCAPIKVKDMSDKHLQCTIKVCKVAARTATFECDKDKWQDWIEVFERELYGRGESRFEIKEPATYNDPSKIKPTRGAKLHLICHCGKEYSPRIADLKRGWGKSCSKRCSSIKRDFGRPDPRCAATGVTLKSLLSKLKQA